MHINTWGRILDAHSAGSVVEEGSPRRCGGWLRKDHGGAEGLREEGEHVDGRVPVLGAQCDLVPNGPEPPKHIHSTHARPGYVAELAGDARGHAGALPVLGLGTSDRHMLHHHATCLVRGAVPYVWHAGHTLDQRTGPNDGQGVTKLGKGGVLDGRGRVAGWGG